MKYCLHSRLSNEYLLKANEIKVQYRDKNTVFDLIDKYPKAMIILEESLAGEGFNWAELIKYNKMAPGRFMLCLADIGTAEQAKKAEIPFYMGYPAKSFYEMEGLKNLGVSYIRIDAPIFFSMNKVKGFNIPIRVAVNLAYSDMLPREDGICGLWVRPEDAWMYEEYVDVFEFTQCEISKEEALYRIYAEQKEWPGELQLIVTNLDYPGLNRMILPEVTDRRLNCGQRCIQGAACRLCYRALDLADRDKVRAYVDATDQS